MYHRRARDLTYDLYYTTTLCFQDFISKIKIEDLYLNQPPLANADANANGIPTIEIDPQIEKYRKRERERCRVWDVSICARVLLFVYACAFCGYLN